MASTSAPRALSRAVRRKRWPQAYISTRHIATAPAVEYTEPEPVFPEQTPSPSPHSQRKHDIRNAKPFSDFLTDTFDRQHDYLRISLTERCNLRCLYCMPEDGIQLSPNRDLLTTAEIYYLSALFVNQGVNKIRLTGGEPTVRKDVIPLMQQIGSLRRNGLKEIALTTNGISLHRKLDDMVEAGLTGVNISLDTLDPHQFVLLTRRQGFDAVMKSINRVQEMNRLGAGIKLKINCVAMRGLNDHQILPFIEMTRDQDVEVRFIEYMPFDGNKWSEKKMLPYAEMLDLIRTKYPDIERLKGAKNDTSKTWQVPGFKGKFGFITSMTHNFCGTCNRLRITSDGNLKVCLHGNAEVSLRDMLRKDHNSEPMDEAAFESVRQIELGRRKQNDLPLDDKEGWITKERELLDIIGAAVKRKKAKHAGIGQLENMKNRPMILIDESSHRTARLTPSALKRQCHPPPTASSMPWSNVPLHLLGSATTTGSHVRHYSSGSRPPERDSGIATQEDDAEKSAAPSGLTPMFGFQSLSGIFRQPARKRYSTPRGPEQSSTEPESSSDIRPPGNAASSSEPTFKPMPAASQSIESTAVGYSSEAPYSLKIEERSSFASAKSDAGPRQPLVRKTHSRDEKPGTLRFDVLPDKGEPSRYFRQRRDASRRRENPFTRATHADRGDQGTDVPSIAPLNATRDEGKYAAGVNNDSINSVDLMSESGMTNVAFQGQASTETASITLPSKYAFIPRAESPGRAPESGKVPINSRSFESARGTKLTHVTSSGQAHMVDVGAKESTKRIAIAHSRVTFSNEHPFRLISENANNKGDVLGVARIAGIMASKRTADLIPLCHPISISKVEVDVQLSAPGSRSYFRKHADVHGAVTIHAVVECVGPTGVEMEALTAVSGATLTVYDMCKAVDRSMSISATAVVYKSGGRSGKYVSSQWNGTGGADFLMERGIGIGNGIGIRGSGEPGESDTAQEHDRLSNKTVSQKWRGRKR